MAKIDQIQALQDETLSRIREATSAANADLLAEHIFINSRFFQLLMSPDAAPEAAPTLF